MTNGAPASAKRLETRLLVKIRMGFTADVSLGGSSNNATLVAEEGLTKILSSATASAASCGRRPGITPGPLGMSRLPHADRRMGARFNTPQLESHP